MNKLSFLMYEQDILQIIFDSREEYDAFIETIDNFINMEAKINNVAAGPQIASLVEMLNDNLRDDDDGGMVWTFVFLEKMPAVFLAFCNCVGIFNILYDSTVGKKTSNKGNLMSNHFFGPNDTCFVVDRNDND